MQVWFMPSVRAMDRGYAISEALARPLDRDIKKLDAPLSDPTDSPNMTTFANKHSRVGPGIREKGDRPSGPSYQ